MTTPDHIIRCLLGDGTVRIVAACTTKTAREAARRHDATGVAAAALARAVTAGALLATLTKDDERLTLQLVGDGPLGTLTVDSSADGLRVFAKNPAIAGGAPRVRVSLGDAIGRSGVVTVVRDVGVREHFSGQTTLVDGEIDTDVEHYLIASEQIESALGCEALLGDDLSVRVSAGVLIQTLPGSRDSLLVEALRARLRDGALAELLGALPGQPDAEAVARAVLGGESESLRVLDVRPLQFHCPCSPDRAANTLALLGPQELAAMVKEAQGTSVTCHFCRETYQFAPEELEAIRAELIRTN